MHTLKRFFLRNIGNTSWDTRLGEWGAYAAALTLFVVGMRAVPEHATNRWELLVGTLAVLTLDVVLVLLGLVAGMRKPASGPPLHGAN